MVLELAMAQHSKALGPRRFSMQLCLSVGVLARVRVGLGRGPLFGFALWRLEALPVVGNEDQFHEKATVFSPFSVIISM